jgi:small conductance mechanosensitive channel
MDTVASAVNDIGFFDKLNGIYIGSLTLAGLLATIILFIVCLIVRKIVNRLFARAIGKTKLDGSLKSFLTAAVNIILWIIIILVVCGNLGIPMTSLVALMSVVALALSLSVQNILENLFSGMTILATHPFGANDFVDVGGTSGTITAVGLFYTTMLTNDGKTVHMPNSTVTSAKVINYSVRPVRRVDLEISVSYDDDTDAVKSALLAACEGIEGVAADPAPFAAISDYGSSNIKYVLLVWVSTADYLNIKFKLTENVRRVFAERHISMTYDHLNVHVSNT